MTRDLTSGSHEERLNEVLLTYVEALQAGQKPDQHTFLETHPDLRSDLEAFFAGYDEVERLAVSFREAATESPSQVFPDAPPEIGRLGDFRLLREVGRGGMGVVYEAEQFSLRRRVALKVLPFAAAIDPRQLQRFKNEALAAANLRHEHIVPVYAVGEERGVHFYAMQFIDGQSLAQLIADWRQPAASTSATTVAAALSTERSASRRGHYPWVASLGRQAALALEHAHQTGIVHRDVKPANLLVDPRGQLWVTDFGLAQIAGDTGLTMTGEMLGTLRYASPEQALGRRGLVDHRGDIYSLGATLYELLTLRPLFEGHDRNDLLRQIGADEPKPPRAVAPSIPAELETIVLKAVAKEPADRYATAQELADDLQRFLDNRPIRARRPTAAERLRKWTRRHPGLVVTSMVVLVLLSAVSLVSTVLIRGEQRRAEEAYQRERQRAEEAEARFRLARQSVDELFRVSEEELIDRPGMEALRKRLLMSVLSYYQEFIDQRRDDPNAQAELLDTTRRVEQILADLTALRAASKLYLLCQPSVLTDLRLNAEQRARMKDLTTRAAQNWRESVNDIGRLSPSERGRRTLDRARAYEAEVNAILTQPQQQRLRQIGLQSEGSGAFHDPEVVAALELTPEQRERIRGIEEEAFFGWMKTKGPGQANDPKETPTRRILDMLTADQWVRWRAMTGSAVKGPLTPFSSSPPSERASSSRRFSSLKVFSFLWTSRERQRALEGSARWRSRLVSTQQRVWMI